MLTFLAIAIACLIVLPFVSAIAAVGLLAMALVGAVLLMPFAWCWSAFQVNKS